MRPAQPCQDRHGSSWAKDTKLQCHAALSHSQCLDIPWQHAAPGSTLVSPHCPEIESSSQSGSSWGFPSRISRKGVCWERSPCSGVWSSRRASQFSPLQRPRCSSLLFLFPTPSGLTKCLCIYWSLSCHLQMLLLYPNAPIQHQWTHAIPNKAPIHGGESCSQSCVEVRVQGCWNVRVSLPELRLPHGNSSLTDYSFVEEKFAIAKVAISWNREEKCNSDLLLPPGQKGTEMLISGWEGSILHTCFVVLAMLEKGMTIFVCLFLEGADSTQIFITRKELGEPLTPSCLVAHM